MIDQGFRLVIDLIPCFFDLGAPVEFFIIQKEWLIKRAYFFNDFSADHHSTSMGIMGDLHLVILPFIFFPAADHSISSGKGVYILVTCIFNSSFLEIIMKFRTNHACIRVLPEDIQQSFQKSGSKFRIVIDNKKEITFCLPDPDIISTAETKVAIVPDHV